MNPDAPSDVCTSPAVRGGLVAPVFLVSAAVLAFELALMRVLLMSGWHHFAFLVISVALLGFGVSGVALYLARERLLSYGTRGLAGLAFATALAMPSAIALAQRIPVEARFLPALLGLQAGRWLAYWGLLVVPFLLGAAVIGLALMLAGGRVPATYAGNLAGSGAGAVLVHLLLPVCPPLPLAAAAGLPALAGALCVPGLRRRTRITLALGGLLAAGAWLCGPAPELRTDPYKFASQVRQLERQGDARRVAAAQGPEGMYAVYAGRLFHDLPFLTGETAPPPMCAIALDGHFAASVLDIDTRDQAEVLRHVLSAAAYELAPSAPAVLLPGELGGANVWLALVHDAARVDVVHPHPRLHRLMRTDLRDRGGGVWDRPQVVYHPAYPRHFLDHTPHTFDLIHLADLESQPAGSGGMAGLGQHHLLTIEGVAAALAHLSPDGLLVASRGIQDPPRDNIKLLTLFAAALRRNGAQDPGAHLVIFRDFLAVCTVAKRTPWTPAQVARVAALLDRRHLTGIWFPGITARHLNRPDYLPGPPGRDGDWFHYAAREVLEGDGDAFIRHWLFDVRPPTDNRPFFHDFSRWRTLGRLREAYGELWLTRTEAAFLFVLAALGGTAVLALLCSLGALALIRPRGPPRVLAAMSAYFICLGLAYLMIEIAFLARLTRLVGDPVQTAATTFASFLFCSGLGSLAVQRRPCGRLRMGRHMVMLAVTVVAVLAAAGPVSRMAGRFALPLRMMVVAALAAPPAWLMGFPMPAGLARLRDATGAQVAWSWGVNGFASVLAAPLATLIGMTWGFSQAAGAALAFYLIAGWLYRHLPAGTPGG